MKNNSTLLRVCFLIGAVTDGLAILPMLLPSVGTLLFGGDFERLGVEYRYAMGIGASLMAGWTVLLVWGSLKPIERRDILIITIFPVVTGIILATLYGIQQHVIELWRSMPLLIHLGFVSALYVYSYGKSRNNDKKNA